MLSDVALPVSWGEQFNFRKGLFHRAVYLVKALVAKDSSWKLVKTRGCCGDNKYYEYFSMSPTEICVIAV
jgi:hypothetical protein